MKKAKCLAAVCILALLTGLLSACSMGEQGRLRERAEKHLESLKANSASDTFTLSNKTPEYSDKAASVPFSVRSETYATDFTIWVPRAAEQPVTDSYYTLYLKDEAEETLSRLFGEVLGEGAPGAGVTFMLYEDPALSGHAPKDLNDLFRIAEEELKVTYIMHVQVRSSETNKLGEAEADLLMTALREKGYYCVLYPYLSDAVSFEVLKDGFWKTTRSGADSGAYLKRVPYTPGSGK